MQFNIQGIEIIPSKIQSPISEQITWNIGSRGNENLTAMWNYYANAMQDGGSELAQNCRAVISVTGAF